MMDNGVECIYAGHFLLTKLLLDTMKRTAHDTGIEGRIVVVASEALRFAYPDAVRFEKLNEEKR